jgi:hypothetical protein
MNGCRDCKIFEGAASTAEVVEYMIAFDELERGIKRKCYVPF